MHPTPDSWLQPTWLQPTTVTNPYMYPNPTVRIRVRYRVGREGRGEKNGIRALWAATLRDRTGSSLTHREVRPPRLEERREARGARARQRLIGHAPHIEARACGVP